MGKHLIFIPVCIVASSPRLSLSCSISTKLKMSFSIGDIVETAKGIGAICGNHGDGTLMIQRLLKSTQLMFDQKISTVGVASPTNSPANNIVPRGKGEL